MKTVLIAALVLTPFAIAILFMIPIERPNSEALSATEISCGQTWAYLMFDNPIERAFTKGVVVTHSDGALVYASSYTLLGIPLSRIEANCYTGQARRL